ncbi:MAG: hypothetical protein AAF483_02810 [Planctomycetota bacterium]
MPHRSFFLPLIAALSALTFSSARADFVYSLADFSADQASHSRVGSKTTEGTIGALSESNIPSYSRAVAVGANNFSDSGTSKNVTPQALQTMALQLQSPTEPSTCICDALSCLAQLNASQKSSSRDTHKTRKLK